MIGFNIEIEGRIIQIAADTIHVIFSLVKTKDREEIFMDIRGSDWLNEERLNWGTWELKSGDELQIRVLELTEITEPKKIVVKKATKEDLDKDLAHYNELKIELKNANLL
jgi:hypothetical protein